MSDTDSEAPKGEELQEIFRQHMAELEEDKKEVGDFRSLIRDGRGHCDSLQDADLIAKVLASVNRRRLEAKAVIAQAKKRIAELDRREQGYMYLFEDALETWLVDQVHGKKKRSIELNHATVALRKQPPRVKTESLPTLRKWAGVHCPQALNYDAAPIWDGIVAEWEEEHGELAPGRIKIEADDKFAIKYPKPDDRKELGEGEEDA